MMNKKYLVPGMFHGVINYSLLHFPCLYILDLLISVFNVLVNDYIDNKNSSIVCDVMSAATTQEVKYME
uniref:Uncharacterized protein n=1 Tax=Anguilla anguilla TaxID=7936 RepID=A0A0E9PFA7_ANGAN